MVTCALHKMQGVGEGDGFRTVMLQIASLQLSVMFGEERKKKSKIYLKNS